MRDSGNGRMALHRWTLLGVILLLTALLLPAHAETTAMIADLHLTADPDEFAGTLGAIEQIAAEADGLIFLGDNTNNGRLEEHSVFLSWLDTLEKKTGKPVYVIPGNHDLTGDTSPAVFAARYARFGREDAFEKDPESASYAVMTPGGSCLLMLDTNAYDPSSRMTEYGETSRDLVVWAEGVLKNLPEGTDVIACGHYPLFPFGDGRDSTRNAQQMAAMLETYGVRVYFCGHRHNNYTLFTDGLRQINIGVPTSYPAWAGTVTREGENWHYRVEPLYDPQGSTWLEMQHGARMLAERMASGSLEGTAYEGDEEAIAWFTEAFMAELDSSIGRRSAEFLAQPGCEKWKKAAVRAVTREWILGVLESEPEDVQDLLIPLHP